MAEQGQRVRVGRRRKPVAMDDLVPYFPRTLTCTDPEPSLYPDLMPGWYAHYQVLHRSFKDISNLLYRSGFQSVRNMQAIRLFSEGIGIYQFLHQALPSSQRTREQNELVLQQMEAKCNGYRDDVIQALAVYDRAICLDGTVDLSSDEDEYPDISGDVNPSSDDGDIDAILEVLEHEGGASEGEGDDSDESVIIID